MATVKVYTPIGEVESTDDRIASVKSGQLETLSGKSVGFIDDMKPNAGVFLENIEALMKKDFELPATHTVRKYVTPNMAIAHELDPSVEAVVVAWGD